MKNKTSGEETLKTSLTSGKTEKTLNESWGESQEIIQYGDVLKLLQAFKEEGIKDNRTCLIFRDRNHNVYRIGGEQHEYKLVKYTPKPKTIKEMENRIREAVPMYVRGRRKKADITKLYEESLEVLFKARGLK